MYAVIQDFNDPNGDSTIFCLVRRRSKADLLAQKISDGKVLTMSEARKRYDELNHRGVIQHLLIN